MMFSMKIDKLMQKLRSTRSIYCQHDSISSPQRTGVTGDKEKGRLVIRYKNILLIILVIWMFSLAYYRNNVPVTTLDPNRSWGQDVCGFPLPHSYQTPYGCVINSIHKPELPPRGVSFDLCDFFTEDFYPAFCEIEFLTVEAVRRVILPSDSVLEIGSRYGTTTCEVAVRLNNSAKLVAVEPDHTVWAAAEFNKMSHNCAGWSVLGVLAEGQDLTMDYVEEEDNEDKEDEKPKKERFDVDMYNFRPSDRFEGLSDSIYTFTEADGSSEEIDESLETLQTLGFTVNQDMTTGEKDWLGSMIVLTK